MSTRIEVNLETGEVTEVALSPDELVELEAAKSRPEPVPSSVHMRQARLALFNAGLYDKVQAAVAAAAPPMQIWWEYSSDVHRDHPRVLEMAQVLGFDDAKLDELFIAAALLQ